MKRCPRCNSYNIEPYIFELVEVIKCNDCGYDEGSDFEEYPTQKTSQKAKGKYKVYKTGGSQRARRTK